MLKQILPLAQKFIAIPSNPDNPVALQKILTLALAPLRAFTVENFTHNGAKSALVYNTRTRPKKFKILFNAHLDVIPGKEKQYTPVVRGDRLYGVGSMDMKANTACLITVFQELAASLSYPVALQLVTDEEIGGFNGTKHQVDQGVRADFVVAGEPTNFDIVNQAKGVLWLKISARGKTAHGAYPWRGDNAIWKIQEFLQALKKKYPIPTEQKWITTVNVSNVESNNPVFNKIPDACVVSLDIRFVPEDAKTIVTKIRALLPRGCSLDVVANEPALYTKKSNQYIQTLEKIGKEVTKKKIILRPAQGTSDARHFTRVGGEGIEFGPIGQGIGSDNEWVSISSLARYAEILKKFLQTI